MNPRTDGLHRAASVLGESRRVRTIFLGSGDFGRESLRRLNEHEAIDLVGVVTASGSVVQGLRMNSGSSES